MTELTPVAQIPLAKAPADQGKPVLVPRKLGRREKAAVVVRLLLNEGADIALETLPDELQAHLTEQMGVMGLVDRATLSAVIEEFVAELESIGLSFPKGLAEALRALDGKLSPQTEARLRREAGVRQLGDPWERIRAAELDDLKEIVEAESTEVAAVLLSKLDVSKAAELLGRLPGPHARRITYAVSQTEAVTPDAVERIGIALAGQLDSQPILAFDEGPVERVGAILNFSAAMTREDVLNGLEEEDSGFATAVRKAMFTFAHIPTRIMTRDVPRVVREVEDTILITALAGSKDGDDLTAAEFLLSNMSTRLADGLREEMENAGTIKTRQADAARTSIVAAIQQLVRANEITLVVEEAEEDED